MNDLAIEMPKTGNLPAKESPVLPKSSKKPKQDYLANLGIYARKPPNNTGKHWTRKDKGIPRKPKLAPVEQAKDPLTQFTQTQQSVFLLIEQNKQSIKELAVLVPLLNGLEDRRQVLAGHGKPKPVEASNEPRKAKGKAVPVQHKE